MVTNGVKNMTTAELIERMRNEDGMFGAESKPLVYTRSEDGVPETFIKQILLNQGYVYLIGEFKEGDQEPIKAFHLYKESLNSAADWMSSGTFSHMEWQEFSSMDTYSLFCTIPVVYEPKKTKWVSPFR